MSRIACLVLLLSACAEVSPPTGAFDTASAFPFEQLAPPPVITQVGTCPGIITFTISSLTPGGIWRVGRSPNLGPGMPITTGPCAGTALRIGPPVTVVASGTVPISGTVVNTVNVTAVSCGQWLQAHDQVSCLGSLPHQIF